MPDSPSTAAQPVDPDVDLHDPTQRTELARSGWLVLVAVSAGGVLGALARYALAVVWPAQPGGFPWSTFVVNVSGCLLIGVLMVLIDSVWAGHRLARPFLGTGVLGGYTTFSTYAMDALRLINAGEARTALLYLIGTLAACLLAVLAGTMAAGALIRPRARS